MVERSRTSGASDYAQWRQQHELEYEGLSKREIRMRKEMAAKFGRTSKHLNPPKPEDVKVESTITEPKALGGPHGIQIEGDTD